jgi:hypothetical protein
MGTSKNCEWHLQWRASHPETAKIEEEIKAFQFPTTAK